MGSDLAKVLHPVAGAPMVLYPLQAAVDAGAGELVVVVGHQAERVRDAVARAFPRARFALQAEQRGTGHAVLCGLEALAEHRGAVLILSGDVPLLRAATLEALAAAAGRSPAGLALVTFEPPSATGYGRILRERGRVVGIREERDASPEERAIRECNAGIYCADVDLLREELPRLGTDNAQGEIYLTDLVERAVLRGEVIAVSASAQEVAGINTPEQLATIDALLRKRRGSSTL